MRKLPTGYDFNIPNLQHILLTLLCIVLFWAALHWITLHCTELKKSDKKIPWSAVHRENYTNKFPTSLSAVPLWPPVHQYTNVYCDQVDLWHRLMEHNPWTVPGVTPQFSCSPSHPKKKSKNYTIKEYSKLLIINSVHWIGPLGRFSL